MTKPYYANDRVTLYHKGCSNMSELAVESMDLMVTDPPYGIAFMGRDWDRALPDKKIWAECLRVLKPGAFAFVMSIPRADCLSRMIISLEDAGFLVNFTPIFWAMASGFPKAQNMSLTIDKQECRRQLEAKLGRKATKDEFDEAWKGFREIIGKNPNDRKERANPLSDYGLQGGVGSGQITKPATPQAKALDGSYGGFQPKPAVEVILVAMKPLSEKTNVNQALKNQKGITWLDDGRIPYVNKGDLASAEFHKGMATHVPGDLTQVTGYRKPPPPNTTGRFPANLLVSDDVLNDGRVMKSGRDAVRRQEGMFLEHRLGGLGTPQVYHPDSGSFSRYFDLDAWWAEKLKQLPQTVWRTFPFLIVPKASKSEKNEGCQNLKGELGHNRFDQCAECGGYILQNPDRPSACKCDEPVRIHNKVKGNYHPTVKPIKLMSYLIILGSREGDLVVDPFIGTGSTAIACQILGRRCTGYEINLDYCEIAKARCSHFCQLAMELYGDGCLWNRKEADHAIR